MKNLYVVVVVLLFVASCAGPGPVSTPRQATPVPGRTAAPPSQIWPAQGWPTSTPEQQGMDSVLLAQMLDAVAAKKLNIHSILIIRRGYLVAEVYYGAQTPTLKHELYSATKSFTSALIGIAIHKGFIDGVNHSMLDFFADRPVAHLDDRKKAITLEHLLTMSSGLDWPESGKGYTTTGNPYVGMMRSPDWVQFALDRPMAEQPGAVFNYNSGGSHLLSAIVQETTGIDTLTFARENLFKPLGITDVYWGADASGIPVGGSDLRLTPRDMAKFGYLYLRNGAWEGRKIVPAEWVKASTVKHVETNDDALDYGYQWWVYPDGSFCAHGLGGQYIFVHPDRDLVVVFTSWLTGSDTEQPPALMNTFIVPAARSALPLPENPEALAQLKARIESARNR